MEQQRLINRGRINNLITATLLLITTSCIGIRKGSEVDLGGDYYYVQDYPQCICLYSDPGKVILPIGDCQDIVVRVQYNDSIIVATCSPGYHSRESTIYVIDKKTGIVRLIENQSIVHCQFDAEVKNRYWYSRQ